MRQVAQVLLGAIESTILSKDEKDFLSSHSCAGITLFKRNISLESSFLCQKLTSEIQKTNLSSNLPLIIAVDQEGGRVSRFGKDCPNFGPCLNLEKGQTDKKSLENIKLYAFHLGLFLQKVGVNVNFAPVVDILTCEENLAIGDRAFGRSVEQVILRAQSFADGLRQAKVKSCLKHFPGQGDALYDTHYKPCEINLDEHFMWKRELLPFKAMTANVDMVMVSHCIYPQFCSLEASRSSVIMTDLLKKKMHFSGLIVSDDMTMGAVTQSDEDLGEYIIESIVAGCDLVLICRGLAAWSKVYKRLSLEACHSKAFFKRLDQASQKVNLYRQSLAKGRSLRSAF